MEKELSIESGDGDLQLSSIVLPYLSQDYTQTLAPPSGRTSAFNFDRGGSGSAEAIAVLRNPKGILDDSEKAGLLGV